MLRCNLIAFNAKILYRKAGLFQLLLKSLFQNWYFLIGAREIRKLRQWLFIFGRVRVERMRNLKQKLRHCKLLKLQLFLGEIIRKILRVMCWQIQVLIKLILLWEAVKLPGVTAIFQSFSQSRKLSKSEQKRAQVT